MNIFNTSPQKNTETIPDKEESNLEKIQIKIEVLNKRMLEIAEEDRKLEKDIADLERNGNSPHNPQVAGSLRALRNMRDSLAEEKIKILTEKSSLLLNEKKLQESFDEQYAVTAANDEDMWGADGLILAKHDANARRNNQ